MHRNGHVGTLLMVFGALFLVGTALYAFYGFRSDIRLLDADFRGLSLQMRDTRSLIYNRLTFIVSESIRLSIDSPNFENDFKNNLIELAQEERDTFKDVQNNVFAKIVNEEFTLEKSDESYILSINGLFFSLEAKNSVSSNDYNFNIHLKFSKQGIEYLTFVV